VLNAFSISLSLPLKQANVEKTTAYRHVQQRNSTKYSESEIKNDNFTVKLSFLFNSENSVILRYTRNIVQLNSFYIKFDKKSGCQVYPPLYLNNTAINEVTVHKHQGRVFNNKMSWTDHINDICKRCNKRIFFH
jgi:hypothetical protein